MKNTNTKKAVKLELTTGAVLNPQDHRDFPVSADVTPLPDVSTIKAWSYPEINLFPVLNQAQQPACVGHAESVVKSIMDYEETKKPVFLSPKYLYALCKSLDGVKDQGGTFPRIAGKALLDRGVCDIKLYPNDTNMSMAEYIKFSPTTEQEADAVKHKVNAYSFCPADLEMFLGTIYSKKAVGITLVCNTPNDWYAKFQIPAPQGKIMGLHRVLAYGWERLSNGDVLIKCRNSWSENAHAEGKGNFVFSWNEFKTSIYDIMPYIDAKSEVIENNEGKDNTFVYYWNRNLSRYTNGGIYKDDINALQTALKLLGFFYNKVKDDMSPTGYYAEVTVESVKRFQKAKGIPETGTFAFLTRTALNQEFQKKKI